MEPDTVRTPDGAAGGTARPAGDRTWPWPGSAARHRGAAARRRGRDPGGRERLRLHRQLVRSGHDRAHDRHRHRRLDIDGSLAAMTIGTAATPGIVPGGILPAAPGAETDTTAGSGSAREPKRWLAAQGRPGRRFFFAAGLADVAATAGTVILSWYVAALIVTGVAAGGVGGLAGHGLAGDVLGVVAGGILRAAGAFAADRLAAAGAGRAEARTRDAILAALVLGDPADQQVSAGAAVAAISEQLPGSVTTSTTISGGRSPRPWRGRHPRGHLPGQLGRRRAARAGHPDRSRQHGGDRPRRRGRQPASDAPGGAAVGPGSRAPSGDEHPARPRRDWPPAPPGGAGGDGARASHGGGAPDRVPRLQCAGMGLDVRHRHGRDVRRGHPARLRAGPPVAEPSQRAGRRIRPAPRPGLFRSAAALRRGLPPAPGSARRRGDPGAAEPPGNR